MIAAMTPFSPTRARAAAFPHPVCGGEPTRRGHLRGQDEVVAKKKKPARVPVAPRSQPKPQTSSLLTRRRVLVVGAIAAAVAVGLVGASLLSARGGDDGGGDSGTTAIAGGPDVEAMLEGIPQEGTALGEADAPVTLVEYADLQCPFCAEWALQTFPVLVADYVRDGRLRIEFRGLSFIGPESEDALRAALAAGQQGKLWNVVDLIYLNQGAENSGWVTDDFLRAIGEAVPGLDVDRMLEARDSAEATATMEEAAASAQADSVSATPSFLLGETGGELSALAISSLGPEEFRAAIDELLAG
jgi:protein-disulfide isomerase